MLRSSTARRNHWPGRCVTASVNRRQWTCLAFAGAVSGLALVVLVHQPMRVQRCATQTVGGPVLQCEDRQVWVSPDVADMGAAAAVGALTVAGFALPFVDAR